MRFSASGIRKFLDCPGKFVLRYVEKMDEEVGYLADVGKAVHEFIEQRITGQPISFPTENPGPALIEAIELFKKWETDFWKDLNPQDVLSVEEHTIIQLGKHEIEFRMDDLREIGGFPTLTDWKTGHKFMTVEEMKMDIQVRLYCVVAHKLLPSYDEFVFRLGLVRFGLYQTLEVDLETIKDWEEQIIVLLNLIAARMKARNEGDEEAMPFEPGKACKDCGFFNRCPKGQEVFEKVKGVKNATNALDAVKKIAILTRQLKDVKDDLKEWIKTKGPVTGNGLTWAFYASETRHVDIEVIPEEHLMLEKLRPYFVIDDGKSSRLWEDPSLVKGLEELGAVRKSVRRDFKGKALGEEETEGEENE